MPDMIPISVDNRRFTILERLGFLFIPTFLTLHCAGFSASVLGAIWSNIWVGDFTKSGPFWAVGLTILAVPALVAIYERAFRDIFNDPQFVRGSVLLDTRAGRLILQRRHCAGYTRQKSLPFSEILDVKVTWTKDEDGTDIPHLQLTSAVSSFRPIITNPADAADLPAFAARLRAELASAGWSEGRECGTPQGETALARG